MKRNTTVFNWALGGFSIGTGVALGYASFGDSLVSLNGTSSAILLGPGFLVGYHTFDLVGYSAAVSFACLAVGFTYSAIASALAALLRKFLPGS